MSCKQTASLKILLVLAKSFLKKYIYLLTI